MPIQAIKAMPYIAHSAVWTQGNEKLGANELAIESDTGRMKVGDGRTRYPDLPYMGGAARTVDIDEDHTFELVDEGRRTTTPRRRSSATI